MPNKRDGGASKPPKKSKRPPRLPFRNLLVTKKNVNKRVHGVAQIDYVCDDCGRVTKGPHRGEIVSNPKRREVYKGCGISHGKCRRHMQRFIQSGRKPLGGEVRRA